MGEDSNHKNETWMRMKVAIVEDGICKYKDYSDRTATKASCANRRNAEKFSSAKSHIQKVVHDCHSTTATSGQSSSIYIPFRAKRYMYAEYEVRRQLI